jgi:hypothetical protein
MFFWDGESKTTSYRRQKKTENYAYERTWKTAFFWGGGGNYSIKTCLVREAEKQHYKAMGESYQTSRDLCLDLLVLAYTNSN